MGTATYLEPETWFWPYLWLAFDSGKSLIPLDQFSHLAWFFNWYNSASSEGNEEFKPRESECYFKC